MTPNETSFLESTHKIEKEGNIVFSNLTVNISDVCECSFIKFQIWDFPGHIDFCQSEIFVGSSAVIFIIDAQVS